MYPISLSLCERRCLVVGGGSVALRKTQGLLKENAAVTVIAPTVDTRIQQLFEAGEIALHLRPYEAGEAARYCLVFAATDDESVNRRIFDDATAANVWVNVADNPTLCTFHLPARVERGALQIAVASGGEAPFAVRRLRQMLERRLGPEWSEWMDAAAGFRKNIRQLPLSSDETERLFDIFFEATVDEGSLRARVPKGSEEAAWISRETTSEKKQHSVQEESPRPPFSKGEFLSEPPLFSPCGFVSLVGAGPGDPGLLTVKGKDRLMRADAVVCDRLAQSILPCDLNARTSIHFVGKTAGNHPTPQEEINALLIRLAKDGKRVVRLKGGDPYVFGRGGEEAWALVQADIPYEVIPGVTAATAVPAYAGIPVTFRKESVRVTLITAHETEKSEGPQVRWDLLAKDPHAVILGYMGVTHLKHAMQSLIAGGMDPDTPAALIERGTTVMQRTVIGTAADLPAKCKEAALNPPALFVVGPTVAHAQTLDWFGKRPLLGERLVSFQARPDFAEALSLMGAEWITLPFPLTPASRLVMDALQVTGAVFFSPDEVDFLEEERDRKSWIKSPTAWCLTEAAASRARALEWPKVCVVDSTDPMSLIQAVTLRRR